MRRVLYVAPIALERKNFERDVFVEEILLRTQLTFAHYSIDHDRFGIVSPADPSKIPTTLAASVNTSATNTVDVTPGTAVFPSGEIITIEGIVARIPIGNTATGAINVLYLEFAEVEEDPVLTRFNTLAKSIVNTLADPTDYFQTVTLDAWNAFTTDELQLKVPLAVVTVDTNSNLIVSSGKTNLATNRPWFSPVDIEHRSFVGTGVQSISNPHALSLNDISAAAGKTLFQLMLNTGMIVGKDIAQAKVSGQFCQETIPSGSVLEDATGQITGVTGARYFYLSKHPTQLFRCTVSNAANPATPTDAGQFDPTADQVADIAALRFPRRTLVVLLPGDQWLDTSVTPNAPYDLIVTYASVDALNPPSPNLLITTPLTTLPVSSNGEEVLVAGGTGISATAASNLADLADAGPFPSLYRVFMLGDGFLYKTPQTIFCNMKLDDIGTNTQALTIAPQGASKLRVGLTGATPGPNLSVIIQIVGTDSSGNNITEDITFDTLTWAQDINIGETHEQSIVDSKLYLTTTQTFATVVTIQATVPPGVGVGFNNAGNTAIVQVWADLDDVLTSQLNDLLPVADISWDGTRVTNVEDIRPINTSLQLPTTSAYADGVEALSETTTLAVSFLGGFGYIHQSFLEDFNHPKYGSNMFGEDSPNQPATEPGPQAKIVSLSKAQEGLSRKDFYISRPISVKPFAGANAEGIRFIPIADGPPNEPTATSIAGLVGFHLWARVYIVGSGWTKWYNYTGDVSTDTFVAPLFSIDLTATNIGAAGANLLKYQFACTGQVRGMGVFISLDGLPSLSTLVWDNGAWDVGAYS